MTEAEWLAGTDALAMLDHLFPLRGLDSAEPQSRKSRRYLLGCGRHGWNELPAICRAFVAVGESIFHARTAERRPRTELFELAEELTHARGEVNRLNEIAGRLHALGYSESADSGLDFDMAPDIWSGLAHLAYYPFAHTTPHYRRIPDWFHSAEIARDVFGNPFAPELPISPAWRTESVLQLARQAHDSSDFAILPILADALEEAGCDCAAILNHLRAAGPHARGCWALALLLD